MSKKGSVYLRYDIVDEQDLREGVKRLAEGFGCGRVERGLYVYHVAGIP